MASSYPWQNSTDRSGEPALLKSNISNSTNLEVKATPEAARAVPEIGLRTNGKTVTAAFKHLSQPIQPLIPNSKATTDLGPILFT